MRQLSARVVVILLCAIAIAPVASAQSHQELIGAPVYAADGAEVGRVADVSSTGKEIDALRVSLGMSLGLGERSVIIPQPAFMIRRGKVVLPDLLEEDISRFPDASSERDEARDR